MDTGSRIESPRRAGVRTVVVVVTVAAAGCTLRTQGYNPTYAQYPYGSGYTGSGGGNVAVGGSDTTHPGGTSSSGVATGASATLQAADQALRTQGFQPVGNAQRPFAPNETFSFPLPSQPGACYTVLAVGDTGAEDVDLAVIAPSGAVMAQDREPDAHPNASFCPTEYGLHLARVNLYRGSGNVWFVVYQGPPGRTPNLTAALSAPSPDTQPAQTAPSEPDPATGSRIQALRANLSGRGYVSAGPLSPYVMQRRQTHIWPVTLERGWCYTFATFGGPGVSDSDLALFDSSGSRQLAADTDQAVDAVVRDFCPTVSGPVQIRPQLYEGNGTVWFLPMARRNAPATTTSSGTVTQAPTIPTQPSTGTSSGNTAGPNTTSGGTAALDAAYRNVERNLVARGYMAQTGGATHALGTGQTHNQQVPLEAGNCYAVAAASDPAVQDLDMILLDAAGNEVDRDRGEGAQPSVRVCPQSSGSYTVRTTLARGQGAYRVGLFRWNGGTSGAGMEGLLFVRNSEVTRMLQADGFQGDADFELVRSRLREGQSVRRNISLRANTCYAFVAVGGAGVHDLNMAVTQGRTRVAGDDSRSAFPEARLCTRTAGNYRVTIRAAAGSGEYVFRVFRQQQATPSASGGGP